MFYKAEEINQNPLPGEAKMICQSCGMTFADPEEIQSHVLRHGMSARHYKCPKCPQVNS